MGLMRIGLLGGSFDPIHRAHVELAKTALSELKLDEVQLLPARQPWQKPALAASTQDRLAMIELAIGNIAGLSVNPIELARSGKTYTIDTLEQLPAQHTYFWIFGADQLQNFTTWHRWQDVARHVTLVAAQRPGAQLDIPPALRAQIDANKAQVLTLDFEPMDISATELRQALGLGKPVDQWLDPHVAAYIAQKHLYQSNSQPSIRSGIS
ncbi:MAG: nicotinate (nicotinamide) nucleotide adenylyltransferase [Burkholderiaceae bacterium]|nr:nicotinate (nicotinamide) nucleotide adenylyltransferase [Burkholderiaceae bacterium]MCD8537351.1 nicotinate (nicotinamide) nucleotide adenylyltransferase [Burkholderiaceae bacterium]